jgi:hypothetical protein
VLDPSFNGPGGLETPLTGLSTPHLEGVRTTATSILRPIYSSSLAFCFCDDIALSPSSILTSVPYRNSSSFEYLHASSL